MSVIIQINNLNKNFMRTKALDNLNLNIEEGKIYGLLGRNGAGKTTLLKIITSQYIKTSGTVKIEGEDPFENEKILSKICFVSEDNKFIKSFTVREILSVARSFYVNWDKNFEKALIKEFNLELNKIYKNLSKGMQSAVSIIIGLASRSPITIYDEAYTGLDLVYREKFYDILLKDYLENKRTIVFSTHLIDEVSKLFENVIIMDKGKIILEDEADELRNKIFYVTGPNEKVEEVLKSKNVINKKVLGVITKAAVFQQLSKEDRAKLEALECSITNLPLSKLFLHLTSKD